MGLNIAAIFIAVDLGAVTVTLLYDPAVLIPRPPYIGWICGVMALAAFAMILVLGLEEDFEELADTVNSSGPFMHWRAVGVAYFGGVIASATFVGASVFTNYLDRALK